MQDIKGVLIDLDGVVHQCGAAIPGSIEATSPAGASQSPFPVRHKHHEAGGAVSASR